MVYTRKCVYGLWKEGKVYLWSMKRSGSVFIFHGLWKEGEDEYWPIWITMNLDSWQCRWSSCMNKRCIYRLFALSMSCVVSARLLKCVSLGWTYSMSRVDDWLHSTSLNLWGLLVLHICLYQEGSVLWHVRPEKGLMYGMKFWYQLTYAMARIVVILCGTSGPVDCLEGVCFSMWMCKAVTLTFIYKGFSKWTNYSVSN